MATQAEIDERLFLHDGYLPRQGEAVKATSSGDWPTIRGRPNLREAQIRRAITTPGELVHRPLYGGGLVSRVENPDSDVVRALVASAVQVNAIRDPRLESATVIVSAPDDARPDLVLVELRIAALGEELTTTSAFQLEV